MNELYKYVDLDDALVKHNCPEHIFFIWLRSDDGIVKVDNWQRKQAERVYKVSANNICDWVVTSHEVPLLCRPKKEDYTARKLLVHRDVLGFFLDVRHHYV